MLKPCPFCGDDKFIRIFVKVIDSGTGTAVFTPTCCVCGARSNGETNVDVAIAKWNNRAYERSDT